MGMPNLFSDLPVEIFLWVFASTSGLMRIEIGARVPFETATSESASSSGSDSTLKQRMPLSSAKAISASGLADAREHDALAWHAGGERPAQFALGDDVHAGAQAAQRPQDGLVGIRLHGVADEGVRIGEGFGEDPVVPLERRGRIAIERRADLSASVAQVDVLGVQDAVAIGEMMHRQRPRATGRG